MLTISHKEHYCEKKFAEVTDVSNFNDQMATQMIDFKVVIESQRMTPSKNVNHSPNISLSLWAGRQVDS